MIRTLRDQRADNADVEAKASQTELSKSVKETLSAFANTKGGVLLLGVAETDGFAVVGVDNPAKVASDLASTCADAMEPPLRPHIEQIRIEDKWVVVAEIEELPTVEKPCFVKTKGMTKGSYVRVHDGDQPLSTYEVQMLIGNRTQPVYDTEVVSDANVDDALDADLTSTYVSRVRAQRPTATRGLTDDQVLIQSRLAARDEDVLRPTLAGLLALGRYPQQYFPQVMLTLVVYPTTDGQDLETGVRFEDNVALEGPIPVMVRDALIALRRHMSRRAVVNGVGRSDVWDYPETALREAVVNALVHRDLSPAARGTQVQIEMYPDRLSIRNPGGLYGPISVDKLSEAGTSDAAGMSSSRNAFLQRALEDVQLPDDNRTVCENRGSGIRTMLASLRAAGMSPPRFIDSISSFHVVVPKHALLDNPTIRWIASLGANGLTDSQCIALAMLRAGDTLDNARYRAATGLDSRVATNELQDLVVRGLVDQLGTRRWTEYRLATDDDTEAAELPTPASAPNVVDLIKTALREQDRSRQELQAMTAAPTQSVARALRMLREDGLVRIVGNIPSRSPKVRYELTPEAFGQEQLDFGSDETIGSAARGVSDD
ncbi:ATP-dependent DNA helicase RecG [Microbacterium proteolyticum]|uniref:ATP-dependent DNA helicase RecG n=1 Tax=Microbacterium proteolyticum TaxID=1572644 RepID=A0A7W5GG20_9MICO|nr:ATP-binding protein [Microbacterium proteolyticum]MBB3159234.1 ATP-dependent DNA helicase RecG [Microbacterium proteolyticum]